MDAHLERGLRVDDGFVGTTRIEQMTRDECRPVKGQVLAATDDGWRGLARHRVRMQSLHARQIDVAIESHGHRTLLHQREVLDCTDDLGLYPVGIPDAGSSNAVETCVVAGLVLVT